MSFAEPITIEGHAGANPGQGIFMHLRLVIRSGIIEAASFETIVCAACLKCGSELCKMLGGMPIVNAAEISEDLLEQQTGDILRAKRACLALAMDALDDAIDHAIPFYSEFNVKSDLQLDGD